LAFVVRPALSEVGAGKENPRTSAFTDDDWRKILTLAREHGFDRAGEYEDLMFPEQGESRRLPLIASQDLAIALSEVLRKETSPQGETEVRAWVYAPERGWERVPMIGVGQPDRPEVQVGWAQVRQLGELAESGSITVARVEEPLG
jgi:hypothetical protein